MGEVSFSVKGVVGDILRIFRHVGVKMPVLP
jgi:hypothetical protein